MRTSVCVLFGLAIAAAVIAGGATGRARADVLLVKGRSMRENTVPPLVPMPNGSVVSTTDIILRGWGIALGDDDVLVYDVDDGSVSRYGDASTVSLATLGTAFAGLVMIADPRTLTFSALANQEMSLGAILDQPGFMVMVDIGPATVPASILSITADVETPTPSPNPTWTATPTGPAHPSPTPTSPDDSTPALPTTTPTATATPTPPLLPPTATPILIPCIGDCDSDRTVTIEELVDGVDILLDQLSLDDCESLDENHDDRVTVDELVKGVNAALNGCLTAQ